ncbi:MAG: hypothetical protein HUJ86_00980 [Synergistes sp.]|nr:hypothetical protein [Synergistes sp.]
MIADKTILPHAAWIWKMRHEGVKLLSICLEETEELAPAKITLTLKRGGGGYCDNFEDDYVKAVTINREREEAIKFPLVGPHRDDIIISSERRTASEAFSRGLRRRTAAALILAASEGVRRKTGINPILLLDEVTAELDAHGRELLFDALIKRNTQVFAATAEPFEGEFPGTVYRVSGGKLAKI